MNTNFFTSIKLNQMDQVKLMILTDTKYWFHCCHLSEILKAIKNSYYILESDGQTKLPYATMYYDTRENKMYNTHYNDKLNTTKFRK